MSLVLFDEDELIKLFEYKNSNTFRRSIQSGVFPVYTYKIDGDIYARRSDVQEYFQWIAETGEAPTSHKLRNNNRRRDKLNKSKKR